MRWVAAVAMLMAGAACNSGDSTGARRSVSDTPSPATTVASAPPVFDGTVAPLDAARVTASWRPGCPVPFEDLRLLAIDHWGYDGAEHRGELVVHAEYADAILQVFRTLYDARFPVERVELVDVYGGDDFASTAANNTAAFNCRWVVGRPGVWSEHAYGRAIDVNPLVNPYAGDPRVSAPELGRYLDRSAAAPGMIQPGDVVVQAFAAIGWEWGGAWSSPDYQHFSATGR
jgi:D-alanyl-D-alanine carboxypeptidase